MDTREEVAAKIDWEGGLDSALDYGLKVDDMPEGDDELRLAWTRMQAAWDKYSELAEIVARLLPESGW